MTVNNTNTFLHNAILHCVQNEPVLGVQNGGVFFLRRDRLAFQTVEFYGSYLY